MEESSRRLSTVRHSARENSDDSRDAYVTLRSSLERTAPAGFRIASDHLFALFTALAGDLHLSTVHRDDLAYEQLVNKDVGIIDAATNFIGEGRSFSVRALILPPPDTSIVLKSILPVSDFSNREEQTRIGDVILELRALSHQPLRDHPNIVKVLGLGWETDSANTQQKWPVLIQECAHGTLDDLLKRDPDLSYSHRLEMSLGISEGLHSIQRCGIVHGDLKPGNVLIFPSSQPSESQCRWVAKLADFGGSVLDVAEGTKGRLSMRTPPWQAPEWAEYLSRDGLLRTDVYSLGLTIWSIMAKGAQPALNVLEKTTNVSKGDIAVATTDATAHAEGDHLLQRFIESATTLFAIDVDQHQVQSVLAVSLRLDISKRDLSMACQILRRLAQVQNNQISRLIHLGHTPVTQLSHVENILMLPDMLDTLTPCVQDYMRLRLIGVFDASKESVKSTAAFTLAIDALRHTDTPDAPQQCLTWLIRSAENGNQTAQSLVYRFAECFNCTLSIDTSEILEKWLIDAAQRGYPAAQQDLQRVVSPETHDVVWRTIRSRYAGMGWNRFAPLYSEQQVNILSLTAWEQNLRNEIELDMKHPDFSASRLYVNDKGDSKLHFAASAGFEEVVRLWTGSMPTSVDATGADSETPLLIACRSGHGNVAKLLLTLGADPKIESRSGDTPLHWLVAFRGDEAHDLAEALVSAGANVNATAKSIRYEFGPICDYEAGTPLHRAIGKGNVDAVRALLAFGALATCVDGREDGISPISLAAALHYPSILETLLQSLQDPLAVIHPRAGLSLLATAIRGEITYGEKFSKIARHGSSWLDEAHKTFNVIRRRGGEEQMRCFPSHTICAGTTPLLLACGYNLPEVVLYLLEHGCTDDINIRSPYWLDGGYYTPLVKSILLGSKGVFKILIEHGADTTQLHKDENDTENPLIYLCATAGHNDAYFAEALFAQGADINGFKDNEREFETPFACAVRNRCFTLAKWLLEHDANPHIEYSKGLRIELNYTSSVLGFVLKEQTRSSLACIDWLLKNVVGISFMISSEHQYSVLHALAMSRQWVIPEDVNPAASLIFDTIFDHFKPNADQVNQKDDNGRTAIWLAVCMGSLTFIERLLRAGADPEIANEDGIRANDLNTILLEAIEKAPENYVDDSDPRPAEKQIEQRLALRRTIRELLE